MYVQLLLVVSILKKMLFVLSNSYLSYYTDFSSRLPHFIGFIGSSFNLFFFLYLSTMPSKRELKYPFLVFLLINTLSLGYGQRNGVVFSILLFDCLFDSEKYGKFWW